jgi:hypothetical protein
MSHFSLNDLNAMRDRRKHRSYRDRHVAADVEVDGLEARNSQLAKSREEVAP